MNTHCTGQEFTLCGLMSHLVEKTLTHSQLQDRARG